MKHTQGDNPMIELRAISEDNFRECLLLRASVENEDFVDPVTYSLAEAWVYYQDTRPFAIYSDDTIVGFVSMYVGEDNYQIIKPSLPKPSGTRSSSWNAPENRWRRSWNGSTTRAARTTL